MKHKIICPNCKKHFLETIVSHPDSIEHFLIKRKYCDCGMLFLYLIDGIKVSYCKTIEIADEDKIKVKEE